MRTLQRSLLLFVLGSLIVIPQNIFSCGPFFEEATFSFDTHPDYPMKDYISGKLGIIKPNFYRMFLIVAYRNLMDRPFTPSERAALDPVLTSEAESGDAIASVGIRDTTPDPNPPTPAPQVWLNERAKVLGEPAPTNPTLNTDRHFGDYQMFLNCTDSAFTTAVQTMHDRAQKWGAISADLKTWIEGQDVVFVNCSESTKGGPAEIKTGNKLLKQDRDYQIAAAMFYSGNVDTLQDATKHFEAIAQDSSSPWHVWAPYLAARAQIRAATLKSTDPGKFDSALMAEAEARLKKTLEDKNLAPSHHASQQILGFVEARLHPEQRARDIARQLMNGTSTDVAQDFLDYRYLLDNNAGNEPNSEARKDDLTDWIRTFQSGAAGKDHAIAKWQETKSLPWLVAAMSVVDAKDPSAKDLLAAAAKADPRDPRLLSVLYDRALLLRATANEKDARALIDANLAYLAKDAPISSRNLFWGHRMAMAETFDEFLHFAPREDASAHHDQTVKPGTNAPPDAPNDVYFDTDSTAVLNRALPLPMLVQAAASSVTPKPLQSEVAEASWTRALLLNQPDIAAKVAPAVKQSTPELAHVIDQYAGITSDDDRHRAVLFALLHNPGMRPYVVPNMQRTTAINDIDSFRDNWWCADIGARTEISPSDSAGEDSPGKPKSRPAPNVSFLSPADKSAGAADWDALSKLGAAPSYLGAEVIAWAKAAPDDMRIPEALHLVVRATRYGCSDDKTSSFSKQAFQLLHSKYPKSEWTKKTPYFY